MDSLRQKIVFGACILAGVGLAVLIGLLSPLSPQQLAFAAAQALGLFSEKLCSYTPSEGYSADVCQSSCSGPSGGRVLSGNEPTAPSALACEPTTSQELHPHGPGDSRPGDSRSKVSPPEPQSSGSLSKRLTGSLAGLQPQSEELIPPWTEVFSPVAPRYAQQQPSSSSKPPASSQRSPADSSQRPPAERRFSTQGIAPENPSAKQGEASERLVQGAEKGRTSENPSAKQAAEEIPQQLLELWQQMRSGRTKSSTAALASSAMPTAPEETDAETNGQTGGLGRETVSPEQADNSQRGQLPPASTGEPEANRRVTSRPLPESNNQSPGQSRLPSASASSATASSSQLLQEGEGRLIINIRNEDIRKVLEMLSEHGNLNILATSSVQGKVSASLSGVDLDSALQAILRSAGYVARREGKFIYVGTPEDFLRMDQAADRIGTRVYRPNYVKASDLKDLIQPLLTEKVGLVSVSAPAEIGIASDDDKVGGNSFAGNETVLVRDYESVLAQIDQVVAQIDVRPMQVHIQAMILSVRLDDTDKFGVDFKKLINNSNFTIGWGTPVDSLSQVTFTQGGLKFGFIDGDVGAFLEALETVADANVIAAPRLMVLNKHRADILIGRQEGYVNTTQTETATTQTVQFLDIGTQLRIRPFISPDGLIRMEIHPELSDGTVTVQGNFTLPQKDVTKVTTNIMVRDGCTVVIGGLMQEQATSSVNQIPFFGNLPLVGVLFRRKTEELKRVEIIVLVTPHIVREPEAYGEGALQQCEFQRRQNVYLEKMSPLGKRSIARRYMRMAQQAWTEGDMDRALRFAEMAVHFDPLSREALELRAQIWQRISPAPLPKEALVPPDQDSWTKPLDGPTVAPWILQELEKPLPEAPIPESPLPELGPPPEKPRKENSQGNSSSSATGSKKEIAPGDLNLPDSSPQSGLSLRGNPIRSQQTGSKPIARPSVFPNSPLRFP
ncbi:MAG: hypothetical protein NZ602_04100 [Thermoguttaceae bacterium]|nr:hypothetical protein [Thermoguttaceae bacterium]MDW8038340.1 secretin N-terminal domain-containing protein [Thermoguttaceae bacterium]